VTGAELLVQCLEREGVRYVFGVPGEETLDVNDALARSPSVQFIPVPHEQAAAFMADVWGPAHWPGRSLPGHPSRVRRSAMFESGEDQ
jgi:acetolactate synthase-1/2/3 large subunit